MAKPRKRPPAPAWFQPAWLTRQVLALGLVALLTDMGTEMGMPLLPALIASLGGGALAVGLIDGLADAVAALLQVFAGRASDRSGRRKPYVFAGYSLSGLVRPLFGLAAAPWQVVAVRSADRVGKGLRKPSTNALLDQAASPATRGRVFGFYDAMDNAGQMLGPLLAMALLLALAGDLHKVLLCAIVPGALAAVVILGWVREHRSPQAAPGEPFPWIPPRAILPVLLPIAVFSLGNASDLFLLLKVHQGGAALWTQALLWAGYSLFKIISALVGGRLSDRIGPRMTISLGWAFYAAVYGAFALTSSLGGMTALFLAYGLFHGMSEGPLKALVGSLTPAKLKSTGYGWLGLTTGLMALPAGLLFGWLWDAHGAPAAFGTGAGLALLGLALLWTVPRPLSSRA
jgi:MFS family permease